MPGWSLATIEMGIPKVMLFSILLGSYASPSPHPTPPPPHTTPSLFPCLLGVGGDGFSAAGLWVPPPLSGPDPLTDEAAPFLSAVLLLQSVFGER